MSWPTKLVVYEKGMYPNGGGLNVGDMFYGPMPDDADSERWGHTIGFHMKYLSDYYHTHNSHRPPLFVVLPGTTIFCLDGQCWKAGEHFGGWTVTGDAPLVTVHPSINIGGLYHGWLQNGVITDEVEGRGYDANGVLSRLSPADLIREEALLAEEEAESSDAAAKAAPDSV